VRYRADFAYYAGTGAVLRSGRQTEALGLPRETLERFYHGNAERLLRLPEAWAGR
jgi:predicted TIM-barrel fold metal-dependent hydrolase